MRHLRTILKTALLAAQVFLLGGWFWLYLESRTAPPDSGREDAVFEIVRGRTVRGVASDLKARGVLRKSTPFVLLYQLLYAPRSLKAGEYELPESGSARKILETFIHGKILLHPVTVAEGLNGGEIAEVVSGAGFGTADEFLAAFAQPGLIGLLDPKAEDLEGYLFPETYRFPMGTTAAEVVEAMVEEFKSEVSPAWRGRAAELGMSLRDAVILASLIEKETARPEEKKLVSAVFHNRLKAGMKLDCDPTIIYALKKKGPFEGRLRTKDLKLDSPYNTYLYPGLPPGPIANPGKATLEAALYPAEADFLYFVSRNDGTHVFSRTLKEHSLAVLKYQK
jgi:UPF0755 protein